MSDAVMEFVRHARPTKSKSSLSIEFMFKNNIKLKV